MLWHTSIVQFVVSTSLVMWLGARYLNTNGLTLGGEYLIFHYSDMMRHPMEEIRSQIEVFQKAGAGVSRVTALFDRSSNLDTSGNRTLPSGALGVDLDQVTFSYRDDDNNTAVLENQRRRESRARGWCVWKIRYG